jgi:hypothetical protein
MSRLTTVFNFIYIYERLGNNDTHPQDVRDIHEAYRMFGEMICGTHMVHMGSPGREEACSFCFLALRLVSRVSYSLL